MERDVKDIIKSIGNLEKEVYDYITSTENWLFYWIGNKEVQDFIKEYPDDYEDRVSLRITKVDASCSCKIFFDEHPYDVHSIERFCALATFRNSVKAKYMMYNGKVKELQLEELNNQLAHYKEMIANTEEEIKRLQDS